MNRNMVAFFAFCVVWLVAGSVAATEPGLSLQGFTAKYPTAKLDIQQGQVRMIANVKIPTTEAKTATLRAQSFLQANARLLQLGDVQRDFSAQKELTLRQGKVAHFIQTYQGIPVYHGEIKVVLDAEGNVTRVHNHARRVEGLSLVPAISPNDAIMEGWAQVYGVAGNQLTAREMDSKYARLLVMGHGAGAVLAYAVGMPIGLPTERRVAFIDAHTGDFLGSMNQVVYAHMANVYEFNPGGDTSNPQATVVREIGYMAPDQKHCLGMFHYAYNCIDEGDTFNIPFLGSIPRCTERYKAEADENYDFDKHVLPVLGDAETEGVLDDDFSEVHLFYHVDKIYTYFRQLAQHIDDTDPPFETLTEPVLNCVANFRTLDVEEIMSTGQIPTNPELAPFNNAMFVTGGGLFGFYPERDSIIFGQGSGVDFSYDADVIYHEFTHAVVGSTAGLASTAYDQYGAATDPGAMNEGYADFFSATYVGNPEMAEYVGNFLSEENYLRNLTNTKSCPTDVKGEVHDDSEWWSGALWTVREQYKASDQDHWDVDAAIFSAMITLPAEATYTEAATATVESMRTWFGEDAATFATTTFTNRGLFNCTRAVPTNAGQAISSYSFPSDSKTPSTPGYFQLDIQGASKDYIRVEFLAIAQGGIMGGSTDVTVFIRKDLPVTFEYDGDTVTATADMVVNPVKFGTIMNQFDQYVGIAQNEDGSPIGGHYYFAFGVASSGGGMFDMGGGTLYNLKVEFLDGVPPCTADEDCGDCQICNDEHACEDAYGECMNDSDCDSGYVCEDNEGCGGHCEEVPLDGDLTDGDMTADGDNAPDGDVDGDDSDGDTSEPDCTVSADCGDCQICVSGVCLDAAPECEEDEDCEEGEICGEGECGGECQAIDGDQADGDEPADGDTGVGQNDGSGGGCGQTTGSAAWLLLLGFGLLLLRRRFV